MKLVYVGKEGEVILINNKDEEYIVKNNDIINITETANKCKITVEGKFIDYWSRMECIRLIEKLLENNCIPLADWREQQINSILED
jgi:hypothetical protein